MNEVKQALSMMVGATVLFVVLVLPMLLGDCSKVGSHGEGYEQPHCQQRC